MNGLKYIEEKRNETLKKKTKGGIPIKEYDTWTLGQMLRECREETRLERARKDTEEEARKKELSEKNHGKSLLKLS